MSPTPRTVLVVALRRLGDVLLTTPLMRSLKRAWPDAAIDALVFRGTEGVLEGNPDLREVIAIPAKPSGRESLDLVRRVWRAYDLAVSTQSGDRPTVLASLAGRRRIGAAETRAGGVWKKALMSKTVPPVPGLHRVAETLRLAEAAGVAPVAEVVAPMAGAAPASLPDRPFAVVHAAPMFRYKQWTVAGWRTLVHELAERGFAVVATGGPGPAERGYLDEVFAGLDVVRTDGRATWPELGALLRRAAVYVGPDTSVTHLAAACGTRTVALFGPTDPRVWGPWPAAGLDVPWQASGTIQQRGNVVLVQTPLACVPCQLEGCDRHVASRAVCLDEMPVHRVIAAVDRALAQAAGAMPAR
jgi:heptosyltransferase-3